MRQALIYRFVIVVVLCSRIRSEFPAYIPGRIITNNPVSDWTDLSVFKLLFFAFLRAVVPKHFILNVF